MVAPYQPGPGPAARGDYNDPGFARDQINKELIDLWQRTQDPTILAYINSGWTTPVSPAVQAQVSKIVGRQVPATGQSPALPPKQPPPPPQQAGSAVPPGTTNGPPPSLMRPTPPMGGGAAQGAQTAGNLVQAWLQSRSNAQDNPAPAAPPAASPPLGSGVAAGATAVGQTLPQQKQVDGGGQMDPTGGGTVTAAGPLSSLQGMSLGPGENEDARMVAVLRGIGVDPFSHGLLTQYLMQKLKPWVTARAEQLAGAAPGYGGDDPTNNLQTLIDFAKGFTTAGRNGVGEARQLAQGIMGSQSFHTLFDKQDPAVQDKEYQNLMQLMYGGANPLIQSAVQNAYNDTKAQYASNAAGFGPDGTPYSDISQAFGGTLAEYFNQNPQSNIARILSGLYGR